MQCPVRIQAVTENDRLAAEPDQPPGECQRTSFFIAEVTELLSKADILLHHPLEIGEDSSWFPWSFFAEAMLPQGVGLSGSCLRPESPPCPHP